jgi:hypothetical protein
VKTLDSISYSDNSNDENDLKKFLTCNNEETYSLNLSNFSSNGKLEVNSRLKTNIKDKKLLIPDRKNFQDIILSNEEGDKIMKLITPKLNKIKNKEKSLSILLNKGIWK